MRYGNTVWQYGIIVLVQRYGLHCMVPLLLLARSRGVREEGADGFVCGGTDGVWCAFLLRQSCGGDAMSKGTATFTVQVLRCWAAAGSP